MEQSNKKRKILLIIGPLVIFVSLLGITYSFFNYTRTGPANTLGTGRIYFNSVQNNTLNLTNVFPMTSTQAASANLDAVTIGVMGDTTYSDGEEFVITITGINNTVNNKTVPMNYIATYTAASGASIGTSNDSYWTARNSKNANIFKLYSTGQVTDGKQVLVGYIKNGATGISGTLSIKAYVDADRIAISDTYYGNAPTPSPGASPLASPNDLYGTTDDWVRGRTVFTTSEWNSIQNANPPLGFQIKAESQEGIWVVSGE